MANEWIKMRKKLSRDGRIIEMANALQKRMRETVSATLLSDPRATLLSDVSAELLSGVSAELFAMSRLLAIGIAFELWAIADDNCEESGLLRGFSGADIEGLIGVKDLSKIMPSDWWSEKDGAIYLPNYQEHNGPNARRRATNSKCQTKWRKKESKAALAPESKVALTSESKNALQKRKEKKRKEDGEVSPYPSSDPSGSEEKSRPRKRDDLFDAVAEITASDVRANSSHIGKVCKILKLAEPPYTPAEVRSLPEILAARNFSLPLSLGTVEKYIGWTRAQPQATSPEIKGRNDGRRYRFVESGRPDPTEGATGTGGFGDTPGGIGPEGKSGTAETA